MTTASNGLPRRVKLVEVGPRRVVTGLVREIVGSGSVASMATDHPSLDTDEAIVRVLAPG